MAALPEPLQAALQELTRLPGIGRRAAERIVTHLLESPERQSLALTEALSALHREIRPCVRCGNWSQGELCAVCADPMREAGRLCVVERPADLFAFEQSGVFRGRYHVLGGTLSPLRGIGPSDLNLEALVRRIEPESIREAVIATSPTVEGDATAHYLAHLLRPLGVEVARIGVGIPLGATLGYADAGTLKMAFDSRRRIEG